MMCDACKALADEAVKKIRDGSLTRHPNHLRKKKPHCEAPLTCTCQHKPVGSYRKVDG